MVRELEPTQNERTFILKALKESARLDGRHVFDLRTPFFRFGEAFGTVEAALGNTKVLVEVTAIAEKPQPERPNEGQIQFAVDFSPMASPAFAGGRQSDEEILVTRTLEKALKVARAIETESLCILAGEKIWNIRVDIRVTDHDGNLIDCCFLAVIASLLHFRRPEVTVRGEEIIIHSLDEKVPVPLTLIHVPISLSFSFFETGNIVVLDPTHVEEQLSTTSLVIVMNRHGDVCCLTKMGGIALPPQTMQKCLEIARTRTETLLDMIQSAVDMDLQSKQVAQKGLAPKNHKEDYHMQSLGP